MIAVGEKKKCSACNRLLNVDDFYKNKSMRDGLHNQCMPCYREAAHRYTKTPKGKLNTNTKGKRMRQRYPDKWRAREQLRYAVKMGRVIKPSHCDNCNNARSLDGHHDDYSKPLEVAWLCDLCHKLRHNKLRDKQLAQSIGADLEHKLKTSGGDET